MDSTEKTTKTGKKEASSEKASKEIQSFFTKAFLSLVGYRDHRKPSKTTDDSKDGKPMEAKKLFQGRTMKAGASLWSTIN